jgi:hypothetical protein
MKSKDVLRGALSISFTVLLSNLGFAQIPNGNFENWTAINNYYEPQNWSCLNSITSRFAVYTSNRIGDASRGFSVSIYSKEVNGKVVPGILVSGKIDTISYKPISGFAFSERPVELNGVRQFMGYENDNGFIAAYLTKWDNTKNRRDTIGIAYEQLGGMLHEWKDFKIPFQYKSQLKPDSCIIILSASGKTPKANSFLYIDNLSFYATPPKTPVKPLTDFLIYPVPFNNYIFIEKGKLNVSIKQITITDIIGRNIFQMDVNTSELIEINVSNLSCGTYFLKLVSDESTITKKIIKH